MIIENNTQLVAFLPNVLAAASTESNLYEKIEQYLTAAEEWIVRDIISSDIMTTIEGLADTNATKITVQRIVAYEGFRLAVPNLDLILTPNGFGIVSNTNIAPASKERVANLMASLAENRDISINTLLHLLVNVDGWTDTTQGKFFASTLYQDLTITKMLPKNDKYETRYDYYLALRKQIMQLEQVIAIQYVSTDLLDALKEELQLNTLTDYRAWCVEMIQNSVLRCLQSEHPIKQLKAEHNSLTILVNSIRNSEDDAPEWADSDTAELYDDVTIFENERHDRGYWF